MNTKKISAVFITLSLLLQMLVLSVSANDVQQKQNGLSNSLWKLKNGDTFTVGYLGGSITQGVGHTKSNGYANLSFNALKEKYAREGLTFKKLQKGISGTGSNYGAYRIDAEFSLNDPSKVPDLAFIEFSINDNHQNFPAANSRKYMETIARKLYKANPNMDVVFLYTTQITRLDNIDTWITAHKDVADRYGITQINVGKALIDHIRAHEDYVSDEVTFAGSTTDKNYSDLWLTYMSDYVHPSDNGYQVYSDAIMEVLNSEWSKEVPESQTPMVLSESAYGSVDDAYLAGIPNTYSPVGNQIPGTNQTYEISYIDKTSTTALWQTNTKRLDISGPDQVIGFKFTGTGLCFRYRANLYNYGSLKFNIDGKVYMLPAVSSRDWFINVADNLPYGEHTVTILSNETTKGPNDALYIYGFGINGDPDHKGITLIDAGSSLNPLSATLNADKEKISEDEEVTVTASVDCKNPIMDVSFYVNDVLHKGTVTQDSTEFSTKMSDLVVGKNIIKAVVRDCFNNVETNTVEVTSVTKNSVIVPSVLIAAGTAVSSTNYTGERIDIAGAGYNKPLPPKRGLFMKVDMPQIPEGYDIKKVTMLSSIFFSNQFSNGQSGKNLYFYPLSENIESDYKYKADTTNNPNKNLATLLTTESVSTANAPIKYTGGENYSDYVTTGNSKYNYNLYTDVTKFFKNTIYGGEKNAVTKSFAACYAWDNGITFRASTATEIANPIVFLLELEELLDAKFVNDSNITADEAFNLELKVNKESISGVSFNINGMNYIAERTSNGNWTAKIEGLPVGTHTATATVTDADGTTLTKTQKITAKTVINKTCVIAPEVLILAGTDIESNDGTYSRMDIAGAGYNKPLPPKRGLFMKVNMPEIDENYEIEKVTMLSSIFFDSHFSSGQSGKNLFFYPLSENIDSTYKYKADTANNPDKNLATLLTTESVSTANAPVKYTGGENYSDYATTGNSKYNYNLYTDVTKFFKNTIYNGEKNAVTKSFAASYAWDNGITFRASSASEIKQPIVFLVEVSQLIKSEFVSDNFAHTNEGFGIAVNVDSDNISDVTFDINGKSYTAELNANGEWATFIEAGLPDGSYEITAAITDNNGKKATAKQDFFVTPSYKFINPSYCVKLQASDGKMWSVGNANNYNLKYQDGEYKETLYSAVNISSLTNADIIDTVYLATSTAGSSQLGGSNSWTQFRFDACSEVSASTLPGGKATEALPELGEKIAEDVFTTYSLKSGMPDYKLFEDNIAVSSNTTANYMKINVTDYVKTLIKSGDKMMYFRTAVSPMSDQSYSFALNNTNVKLLVKYKSPSVIDNHNGTTSYVITPADYNAESVHVITATYANDALESVTDNKTITDRTLFTFTNGEPAKIFIWENLGTMKPLDEAIIVQ